MRIIVAIVLVFFNIYSFSQSLSENDIKQIAQEANDKLKGFDIGTGITIRGCYSAGRTLVYLYDVTEDWYPIRNMKEDLLEYYKKNGSSEFYFNNDINLDLYYYCGSTFQKKISIKSNEFSNLNFSLGNYVSINGLPDAKGVNLEIKQPIGWELEEGDRLNIVMKFVYGTNSYMVLIKDNYTFFSRNEAKELLSKDENVNELISEFKSYLKNSEVLNHKIVTIDSYPALESTIRGDYERLGYDFKMIMKSWMIFYEDKIVFLQCGGLDGKEFNALESLYHLITNSVIFPEQYN